MPFSSHVDENVVCQLRALYNFAHSMRTHDLFIIFKAVNAKEKSDYNMGDRYA